MQGVPSATHSGWEVKDEQLVMALGGALALAKAPAKRQKIVLTVSALLVPGDAGGAAASGTHPTIATTVGVPKSQLCTAAAAAPLLPRPLCRGPSAAAAPLPEGVSEQQRAELPVHAPLPARSSVTGPTVEAKETYFTTTESRISGFY